MFKKLRYHLNYMVSWASKKAEDREDPAIQISQAVDTARQNHQNVLRQAGNVLGNEHQVKFKLERAQSEYVRLEGLTKEAIMQEEKATREGNAQEAAEYRQVAGTFARQLVAGKENVEILQELHLQSVQASATATALVEESAQSLRDQLTEASTLMAQHESTRMQETINTARASLDELAPAGTVPTLAQAREKIQARAALAIGSSEIYSNTNLQVKMRHVEQGARNSAANTLLEEMREQLHLESGEGERLHTLASAEEADSVELSGTEAESTAGVAATA